MRASTQMSQKILHATVDATKRDHGLEFLGDDGLRSVGFQVRHRKVEQHGIDDVRDAGLDGIAEPDG